MYRQTELGSGPACFNASETGTSHLPHLLQQRHSYLLLAQQKQIHMGLG